MHKVQNFTMSLILTGLSHTYTYTYTYIHTHIHTYIHTYTHTHAKVCQQ